MKHFLSLKNVWVMLLMLTITVTMSAQPNWSYINTGSNHTILVQPGTVTINGTAISNADYIGAFYDSAGTMVCAGYSMYAGGTAVSIWGAEPGVDNGFQNLEPINWKVWVASTGAIVDMVATYSFGSGFYTTNAMSGILTMTGTIATSPLGAGYIAFNANCFGACNGSIDVSPSDGTLPYTYLWSNGETTEDLISLCAGNYDLTITDGASDQYVVNVTITEPTELVATAVLTDLSANSSGDGAIDLTVSGGTLNYSFAWSNGETTEDITGLAAGTYDLTITDGNICITTDSYTLTEPAAGVSATGVATNVSCYGVCDGEIDVTVTGTPPFTYAWSNGETTEDLTGLCAGMYDLTVTEGGSGSGGSTGVPFDWSYTITASNHTILAQTATGSFSINGLPLDVGDVIGVFYDAGGTLACGGYLVWDGAGSAITAWGADAPQDNGFQNNEAFTWKVWRVSDGVVVDMAVTYLPFLPNQGAFAVNGMSGVASLTGTYSAPSAGSSFVLNVEVTEPDQIVVTDIVLDVPCFGIPAGGIDVTVSGGTAPYSFVWSNGATTQDLFGLAGGNYDVTVTDASTCTYTNSYQVNEPTEVMLSEIITNVSTSGGADGAIDLTVSGGTAPFTFSWSNGASTEDIAGLSSGVYNVTVMDANSCLDFGNFTVSEPDPIVITVDNVVDVLCNGDATGSIDVTISGGTPPYSIVWTNAGVSFATTEDINELSAGSYSISVTDINSETASTSIEILEPLAITGSAAIANITCFGNQNGSIDLTILGGVTPYTFNWNNNMYTTEDISGVGQGTYEIIVTDANGCTFQDSYTITEPLALNITAIISDYSGYNVSEFGAADGSIDATVTGGTMPYSYLWDGGETVANISGLAAGGYTLYVTDANMCVLSAGYVLTEPAFVPFAASGVVNDATCYSVCNGEIDLTVLGGETPYTFEWSNGETTEDVTGLCAGMYNVTVTDASGGGAPYQAFNWNYTITGGNHTILLSTGVVSIDGNPIQVGDVVGVFYDSAGTMACGGFATWTGGPTAITAWGAETGIDNGFQVGEAFTFKMWRAVEGDIIDLTETFHTTFPNYNTYIGNGMSGLASLTGSASGSGAGLSLVESFTISEPTEIVISGVLSDYSGYGVSINGGSDGSIDVSVSGGTPPYTYTWLSGETTEDLMNIPAGTYEVEVMDANSCIATAVYTLTEPAPSTQLQISAVTSAVSCNGGNDGAINLTVSGGLTPYIIVWSNFQNTEDIFGLSAGTYSVIVTDANATTVTGSYVVNEASIIDVTATITDIICFGDASGAIDVTVTGGTPPYSYSWDNGESLEDISGLLSGTYEVVVTDANMCSSTASFMVNELNTAISEVANATICDGDTYIFGTQNLMMAGQYTEVFQSVNGCDSTVVLTLSVNPVYNEVADATICDGDTYIFGTQMLTTAGQYTEVFQSANGCDSIVVLTLNVSPVYNEVDAATICDGDTYMFGSQNLMTAGQYTEVFQSVDGCDSTVVLTLTVNQIYNEVADATICDGDTYMFGTQMLTIAGQYTEVFQSVDGCDSTVVLTLNVNPVYNGVDAATICDGDTYIFGTQTLMTAGQYTEVFQSVDGCDSTIVLTLVVNPIYNETISVNVCDGQTYTFGTQVLSTTGIYSETFIGSNGCDSTVTLNLDVSSPSITSVVGDVQCFGYSTGSIDITISGGLTPYSYSWTNGETAEDLLGVVAGSYSVTAYDNNGCSDMASFTITEPGEITASAIITDAMIFGGNQGAIDITISGGLAPYTFLWSNGSTDEDVAGLLAGDHSVLFTDANGCSSSDTFTVGQPDALSASGMMYDYNGYGVSCFGSADGSIDLTVLGGTPPYQFEWSNGETTEDVSGLSAGSYDVTVSYSFGNGPIGLPFSWTVTNTGANHTIMIPDAQINGTSIVAGDVVGVFYDQGGVLACGGYTVWTGAAGGSAMTAWGAETGVDNGFQEGEAFIWKVWRASDQQIIDMTATYQTIFPSGGTYTTNGISGLISLLGTSNFFSINESISLNFVISEPAEITVSETITNVLCDGGTTGAIDLSTTGGVVPYIYTWSNGDSTEDIANLAGGTYDVTVSDANGCLFNASYEVLENAPIVIIDAITDVNCYGGNDGMIALTISGGTPAYSFLWSNGATDEDLNSLITGTYDVTVTDINGCMAYGSYVVGEPTMLSETAIITDVACGGNSTGVIDLSIMGGTAPYIVNWSNGASGDFIFGLAAGDYSFTITDANSCELLGMYTISETQAISLTATLSNASCHSYTDGSVDITVTGGSSPYDFVWSNATTDEDAIGLGAGGYAVTVTDANSCSVSALYFLSQPQPIFISGIVTQVSCNGLSDGSINVNVSGGTPGYTYMWSNSETTQDLSTIGAGIYEITVSDINNCIKTKGFIVTEPTELVVGSQYDDVSCFGLDDGFINQNVSGGATPYTFIWSNGEMTEDLSGLGAGTYDVTVTDANNCAVYNSYVIHEPALLTVTPIISSYGTFNVSSFGASNGHIVLLANGGTQPYFYNWDNGATTYYRIGLSAGTYNVTVTDLNGCNQPLSYTLTEPANYTPMTLDAVATDALCHYNNPDASYDGIYGNIDLTVNNGSSPYTYLWNNNSTDQDLLSALPGTYTVTVTDATMATETISVLVSSPDPIVQSFIVTDVSCNGGADGAIDQTISGGTQPYTYYRWRQSGIGTLTTGFEDISGLSAGSGYYSLVHDSHGCEASSDYITIYQPAPIVLTFAVTDPLCANDGTIDLSVTGGTAPYTYAWSNGSVDEDPANLAVGTYTVVVTDSKGCMQNGSVDVLGNLQLQVSLSATDITCYGAHNGMIDLIVSGGFAPFTYAWDNGATDANLMNLAAGTFEVVVTDFNNCSLTASVTISEPADIVISETITNVTCADGMNGAIDLTVTGGVMPYTYLWNDFAGSTTQDLTALEAGMYTVTISDAQGCMKVETFEVTQPAPLAFTFNATMLSCYKSKDGSISLNVTGGTAPYSYYWSNNMTTSTISGLKAGTYNFYVVDANFCIVSSFATGGITITQPAAFYSTITQTQPVLCNGDMTAALDLQVVGGNTPYFYDWSNGDTDEDITGLGAGTYSVEVIDSKGCTTTSSKVISQPAPISSQMFQSNVSCYGDSNGSAAILLTGGAFPYSYEWSNGLTSAYASNLASGIYTLTFTDGNSCTGTNTVTILEPEPIAVTFTYFGGGPFTILATVTGGTAPYSYQWSPSGVIAPFVKNVTLGSSVTLTITDYYGCSFDTTFIADPIVAPTISGNSGTSNTNPSDILFQLGFEETVNIYPNPNNTGVFYISTSGIENITSLQVYDINGRIIKSDYQLNDSKEDIQFKLENISKGMYYLRISSDTNKVITKKLIITE